jgi:signal transduction histidine kinase
MSEPEPKAEPTPQREAHGYAQRVAGLEAEILRYEGALASFRYRLHQREQGLLVLAELQQAVGEDLPLAALLEQVAHAVNERMGMDRTIVLAPSDAPPLYAPVQWAGYPDSASAALGALELEVPPDAPGGALLVNAATPADPTIDRLRKALGLPFFVCTPIGTGPSAVGLLLTGRLVEEAPARPPLDKGDEETVQAIAGLVFAFEQAREVAELKVDRERRRLEVLKARELTETRRRLRETQAKLVEQDRLASLGRLTAGVAHEIKNPLNFVNNFAAISVELVDEIAALIGTLRGGAGGAWADIEGLLADLRVNAARIEQHGRRADDIVRAMLLHSRADEGDRRAVDLNALVEEHLDLAYHGIYAEAPGFRVRIGRDYAEGLGPVEVVPRDVGRVLLNLLSNAFHAVRERAEHEGGAYEPAVTVATAWDGDHVEVRITDNGPGIPEGVRAKVFEPFFTTKPPGMGTGLGLSLSHDLVTRGHGGTLEVESDGRSGTTFVVTLPRAHRATPQGPR